MPQRYWSLKGAAEGSWVIVDSSYIAQTIWQCLLWDSNCTRRSVSLNSCYNVASRCCVEGSVPCGGSVRSTCSFHVHSTATVPRSVWPAGQSRRVLTNTDYQVLLTTTIHFYSTNVQSQVKSRSVTLPLSLCFVISSPTCNHYLTHSCDMSLYWFFR